ECWQNERTAWKESRRRASGWGDAIALAPRQSGARVGDLREHLYQIPESLTPAADSRISVDVIQHGKQLLEGLPCLLRFRFALTLTRLNCTSWREDRAIPIRPDVFWRLRRFTPAARAQARRGLAALACRSCAIGFFASTPRVPTVS